MMHCPSWPLPSLVVLGGSGGGTHTSVMCRGRRSLASRLESEAAAVSWQVPSHLSCPAGWHTLPQVDQPAPVSSMVCFCCNDQKASGKFALQDPSSPSRPASDSRISPKVDLVVEMLRIIQQSTAKGRSISAKLLLMGHTSCTNHIIQQLIIVGKL